MGNTCSTNGEEKRTTITGWKARTKRSLRRPRRRWAVNFKMNLGKIVWGGLDRTGLAQNRDQWRVPLNAIMNLRVE
jgi:hypothetical protein